MFNFFFLKAGGDFFVMVVFYVDSFRGVVFFRGVGNVGGIFCV